MIQGLIFDLDGCLIDSSVVQKKAFLGSYSIVVGDDKCPSYDEYIKHTGDSVDNVFRKMGLPLEMAHYYREISRKLVDEVVVNWDLIKLIEQYRDFGINIAICTGKDHDRTEETLKYHDISYFFDTLVCSDDVKEPKPSPEPVLKAISLMECHRESVLMIGDGYNDIISAQKAGIQSVQSLWYGNSKSCDEADFVARDIEELERIINELRVV